MPKLTMGIFCESYVAWRLAKQRAVQSAILFADAAREAGVDMFYFSLHDVDLEKDLIWGHSREPGGTWVRTPRNWPNVLYDRCTYAEEHEYQLVRQLRERLLRTAIPINSSRGTGKWFLYKLLAEGKVSHMLVPTVRLTTAEDLTNMLHRYKGIMVKPIWGSGGNGITRAWINGAGEFCCQDAKSEEKQEGLTPAALLNRVYVNAHDRACIIQPQLSLARVEGDVGDIRVNVEKGITGEWAIGSAHMRVARGGQFVTNIRQGAEVIELLPALKRLDKGPRHPVEIYREVQSQAIVVALEIERAIGRMGDMGLDFLLDSNHKLWFNEANSVPDKLVYPYHDPKVTPVEYIQILNYAKYLSKT